MRHRTGHRMKDPDHYNEAFRLLIDNWQSVGLGLVLFGIGLGERLRRQTPLRGALWASTCGVILAYATVAIVSGAWLWATGSEIDPRIAFGVSVWCAFMGVEWLRQQAESIYQKLVGRWLP